MNKAGIEYAVEYGRDAVKKANIVEMSGKNKI